MELGAYLKGVTWIAIPVDFGELNFSRYSFTLVHSVELISGYTRLGGRLRIRIRHFDCSRTLQGSVTEIDRLFPALLA